MILDVLSPSDLQKIGNLQVFARMVVEGFCSGLHRSPHKGFSVEFKQHRAYVPGDELRRLDWGVFGRSDRFYIREYEEETNLRATLVVDCSGSMGYSGERAAGVTKQDYAVRLAACLAHLMLRQQDSVGLVTFDRAVRSFVPARSRAGHLKVVLEQLQASKPGGETELATVFHQLVPRLRRRGLLIILSDCFSTTKDLLEAFARLRHQHHEVLVFHVLDPDEIDFPFREWTDFQCLERDQRHLLLDPAVVRDSYVKRLEQFRLELTQGCSRHRIDLVPVQTDQPYADSLAAYLNLRLRRS